VTAARVTSSWIDIEAGLAKSGILKDAARFLRQRSLAAQPERQRRGSRNGNPARTPHHRPPGSRRDLDVVAEIGRISRQSSSPASPR
jgi:hypothetical protein